MEKKDFGSVDASKREELEILTEMSRWMCGCFKVLKRRHTAAIHQIKFVVAGDPAVEHKEDYTVVEIIF